MKPTIDYIARKFQEFNTLMFGGKLKMPPMQLSRARTFVGQCAAKKRRTLLHGTQLFDFRLKFSICFDLPEREWEDTIIHEMIHYYIFDKKLKDTSTHGRLFRSMMATINETYKRHITISHNPTEEEMSQLAGEKKKTHVVVVVKFADGKTGVKNLPADENKIGLFNKRLHTIKEVVSAKYYLSDNTYFNRIPCSVAFRFCIVKEDELDQYLKDAKTILEKK